MKGRVSGASKTGTGFSRSSGSKSGYGSSVPQGQSKVGTNHISGGSKSGTAGNSSGRVETQSLRGYVHNANRSGLPAPQDVTVAPDGRRRVQGDKRA